MKLLWVTAQNVAHQTSFIQKPLNAQRHISYSSLKYIANRQSTSNCNIQFQTLVITRPILTYLLTPWSRVLLEKLTGFAANKKFPAFYGTRKSITILTSARHLSLSWANSIQSPQPLPTSWRSILILPSHLRLGLPKWSLSLRFPHQNLVHASPFLHTCHMPRPSHSSRFHQPHNIGWVSVHVH